MDADTGIWTVTLADFEDQLEQLGVHITDLGDHDILRLQELYATNDVVQWKVFESVALAANAFAETLGRTA